MLRSELISALHRVRYAITKANIPALLRTESDTNLTLVLTTYSHFISLISEADPTDRTIIETLGLESLLNPDWWTAVFARTPNDRPRAGKAQMYRNVDFAIRKLPQIIALLNYHDDEGKLPPGARLTVLLTEQRNQTSTPQRIIASLDSITLLYRAICKLHNESEDTLALVRCDSGSDKSFDFTGLPQVIEQVKVVVFGIMDRVIFFRERKFSERVKLVAESLPVLNQIAEMAEAKKLSAEQAELLRRDLIAGATKFLETGSSIPELADKGRYEPTALLGTAPTLLLEGPKESDKDAANEEIPSMPSAENIDAFTQDRRSVDEQHEQDEDLLTDEEKIQLASLLKKARQSRRDDRTSE